MSDTHTHSTAAKDSVNAGRIRTGIGGWDYAPWRETFYPQGLAKARQLEFASRALGTIEINSTFYRAQSAAVYAKWRSATPQDFVFALKAPRYLTHRKQLHEAGPSIGAFIEPLEALGDRLGPINWQLSPAKAFDADDITAFLAALPRRIGRHTIRHAIEVRHPSFECAEFVGIARAAGVAIVCSDSPDYPSITDVTADFAYLRLMQSVDSLDNGYTAAALDEWAGRTRIWAGGGIARDLEGVTDTRPATQLRDVFAYFINGAKQRAPAAAIALAKVLHETPPHIVDQRR